MHSYTEGRGNILFYSQSTVRGDLREREGEGEKLGNEIGREQEET